MQQSNVLASAEISTGSGLSKDLVELISQYDAREMYARAFVKWIFCEDQRMKQESDTYGAPYFGDCGIVEHPTNLYMRIWIMPYKCAEFPMCAMGLNAPCGCTIRMELEHKYDRSGSPGVDESALDLCEMILHDENLWAFFTPIGPKYDEKNDDDEYNVPSVMLTKLRRFIREKAGEVVPSPDKDSKKPAVGW